MQLAYLHYLCGDDTALNHVRQFANAARQLGHSVDVHAMNLACFGENESSGSSMRARLRRAVARLRHGVVHGFVHQPSVGYCPHHIDLPPLMAVTPLHPGPST